MDEDLYQRAVTLIVTTARTSISFVQTNLHIGYAQAAQLIERMEREGIVTPPLASSGKRCLRPEVLSGYSQVLSVLKEIVAEVTDRNPISPDSFLPWRLTLKAKEAIEAATGRAA